MLRAPAGQTSGRRGGCLSARKGLHVVLVRGREVARAIGEQRADRPAHGRSGIAAPEQVVGESRGRPLPLAPQQPGETPARGLEGPIGLADLLASRGDGRIRHLAGDAPGQRLLTEPPPADPAATAPRLGPPAGAGLVVHGAAGGWGGGWRGVGGEGGGGRGGGGARRVWWGCGGGGFADVGG